MDFPIDYPDDPEPMPIEEFEDERVDNFEDELEEALMNCGRMRDGTCSWAGSEECEFECPFRE